MFTMNYSSELQSPTKSKQKIMSLFLCPKKNSKRKPLCILQTNDSIYLIYIVNPHAGTNPSSLTHSSTIQPLFYDTVHYRFLSLSCTSRHCFISYCCLHCVPNFPFGVLLFKHFYFLLFMNPRSASREVQFLSFVHYSSTKTQSICQIVSSFGFLYIMYFQMYVYIHGKIMYLEKQKMSYSLEGREYC